MPILIPVLQLIFCMNKTVLKIQGCFAAPWQADLRADPYTIGGVLLDHPPSLAPPTCPGSHLKEHTGHCLPPDSLLSGTSSLHKKLNSTFSLNKDIHSPLAPSQCLFPLCPIVSDPQPSPFSSYPDHISLTLSPLVTSLCVSSSEPEPGSTHTLAGAE